MALNGITINALVYELSNSLVGGRIQKIAQPEDRGLMLTVHTQEGSKRLYISANASLPLLYITDENRPSPMTAPNFVMVLRKYIGNARITGISQEGLERVIRIDLEHLDELKDAANKRLYIEIMGKHSNIIFTDESNKIIDAIKHVGSLQSSVREVLPGRPYFIPTQSERLDALQVDRNTFKNKVLGKNTTIEKAISGSLIGFSSLTGRELAARAGLDASLPISSLHESEINELCDEFEKLKDDITSHKYSPVIILNERGASIEFSPFSLTLFPGNERIETQSVSDAIRIFYDKRNKSNLIKQKSADLKKVIQNCIERNNKKLALQQKQLSDTEKSETLRLYGELLQTYGHSATEGANSVTVTNYYDNTELEIPLDPELSGIDNSKKYFERYSKLKRTRDAILPQIEHTNMELSHLATILSSLDMCETDEDIASIKQELSQYGYIKKREAAKGKKEKKNPPLHYRTEDGFDLYVGKNNFQNEEVTFKIARGNDWWFHVKDMPGSHVILKTDEKEIPDHIFEIAASLAAYYSSMRESNAAEVDYVQRKHIKRPSGAAPGYVIYYTNYSMMAAPQIDRLELV